MRNVTGWKYRWIMMVAATVGAIQCPPSRGQESTEEKVSALAQPYVDAKVVVGLSIGVIAGGKSTDVHVGAVQVGGQSPNANTIYEIGSVSKVFTGALLADAVERKTVKLDQPAQELMPEGAKMPGEKDKPITLAHLSTHLSGLPRLPDNMPSLTSENPYADYTSKLAYEFLSTHQLERDPGAKHEYSNFAASFLGYLISKKSELSYDDLLKERIAVPLQMNDTSVALTDSMKTRIATPYSSYGETTVNWDFADMPGAGGIRSSTSDMLRFAQACLVPPQNEVGRAIETSWKKHFNGGPGEPAMGLGWHFAGDGSTRWHNGQTGGYHSMLMVNRDAGLAVVLLTNTASMEVDSLASDIIRMLAGQNVEPRQFKEEVKVAPEVMKRYVGKYELAPTFVFTVSIKDEKLMVGVTNQPTFEVFPRSDTEWFYKVVDATLTFKVDGDGKCNALELFQNGARQTAKRVK